MNSIKGLTMTFVFEAESANYGEGIGNVTSLKKLSRDSGRAYTYISRQALRYNIINQMGCDNTPLVYIKMLYNLLQMQQLRTILRLIYLDI